MYDEVVVGVCSDKDVVQHKRQPIIPHNDRVEMLKACRYVDKVYENAPWDPSLEFLEKNNFDYILHAVNDTVNWKSEMKLAYREEIINSEKFHYLSNTKYHTTDIINNIRQIMKNHIDCHKVTIAESSYGYGAFADVNLEEGEVVETGIMMRIKNVDGNENPHLFTWSDDRTIWAAGSGCLPFYNHSEKPNIKKIRDLPNNTMKIIAIRNIQKGEELVGSYYSRKWRTCFKDLQD